MSKIIFATGNQGKLREIRQIMQDLPCEILSMKEAGLDPDIREDGKTFEENALIKARTVAAALQPGEEAIVMADDSGLEVAALGGRPGIYSSRYAPTDAERIRKLLSELDGASDRSARFVCVIAIAVNGEVIETFEGEIKGRIALEPKGENGFGYDPVFIPDGYDRTFAELSSEEKNRISHRARAFAKALEFVEEEMSVLDQDF